MMMGLPECLAQQSVANRVERPHRKQKQSAHKVVVSILLSASAHPNGEVCELPRRPLLEGLDRIVVRSSGKRVRSRSGESDGTSSEN